MNDQADADSDNEFTIVAGASQRGKDVLVSSAGFSYTVKVYSMSNLSEVNGKSR